MAPALATDPSSLRLLAISHELLDRLVDLAGAHVEVAERVRRVPVARLFLDQAQVLRDGSIELALPEQFLGVAECGGAINSHGGIYSIVSNSVRGRNDRRCASE